MLPLLLAIHPAGDVVDLLPVDVLGMLPLASMIHPSAAIQPNLQAAEPNRSTNATLAWHVFWEAGGHCAWRERILGHLLQNTRNNK